MGIDIYARWPNQSDTEREAQYSAAFSAEEGRLGYLREAYHGEPYATKFLCREAFQSDNGQAAIPAAVLSERLPETLRLAEERERKLYRAKPGEAAPVLQSYRDFVALCDEKERQTGQPVTIVASY